MLLILPIVILFVTSVAILIIRAARPKFSALWLVAIAGSALAWLVMLFLRLRLPSTVVLLRWGSSNLITASPTVILDYSSWPFAFGIATLLFSIVLVSPGHLKLRSEVNSIAGSLAYGGLGILAVLSANPITLMLGWAAIDLVELILFLWFSRLGSSLTSIIQVFSTRIAGLMIILWTLVLGSRSAGFNTSFSNVSPQVAVLLLIGIGLRIGIFPLHLPYTLETTFRRGQGTLLRMVPAVSGLVILSRLSIVTVSSPIIGWLVTFALLASAYSSIRWLLEKDDLNSRPYWIIFLSSFAILTVLNGAPFFSLSWGVSMLFMGAMIFLLDSYNTFSRWMVIISLTALMGLPYLANSSGVAGLYLRANLFVVVLEMVFFSIFMAGCYIKVFQKQNIPEKMEQIIYFVYPVTVLLLVISYFFTGVFGWQGSRSIESWWFSLVVILILVGIWIWNRITKTPAKILGWISRQINAPSDTGLSSSLQKILNLEWMYTLIRFPFEFISRSVNFVASILEGPGGILWALLMLAVIIAVLQTGVQ